MNSTNNDSNNKTRTLNNYLFLNVPLLGKGSFGSVYQVVDQITNLACAAKRIPKKLIKEQNISEQLRNEMTVHKKLQHPNIIGYYDQFSTNDDIFIILELCKSETLEMLCENYMKLFKRNISVRLVQHFLKQIINAVYYMHSK